MTWTLAIDTSHFVAVALAHDGVVAGRAIVADTRAHAETLTPSIQKLCSAAGIGVRDLGEFAVGMGPGPFTGLRVGVATALTLAHLAGVKAQGVCSLDVVARQWVDTGEAPDEFVVVADARRKEVYWRRYGALGLPLGDPQVGAAETVAPLPVAGAIPAHAVGLLTGSGPDALDPGVLAIRWSELAAAGDEPYYLRPADATVPGKLKSALPRLRAR